MCLSGLESDPLLSATVYISAVKKRTFVVAFGEITEDFCEVLFKTGIHSFVDYCDT